MRCLTSAITIALARARPWALAAALGAAAGGAAWPADDPSLRDTVWEHGGSDAAICETIAEGSPEMGMPAWKDRLSDRQIRQLIAYIRSLRTSDEPTFFWTSGPDASSPRR